MKGLAEHNRIREQIRSIVKKLNIKYSAPTEPVYSLLDILMLKNITRLRRIGRIMGIKLYSKLQKQQLIDAIINYPELDAYIENCFFALNEADWRFLCKVATVKHLSTDVADFHEFLSAQNLCLLQCFLHQDKLWYIVPKEIKVIYRRLVKSEFVAEKEHYCLINNYATAAVSLYGAISLVQLIELINNQIDRKTDLKELKMVMKMNACEDCEYRVWEDYIVHYQFEEDGFKGVNDLLRARGSKTIYIPLQKDFLKYSDPDYYEWTPQIEALVDELSRLISDPLLVEDIVDEIHDTCNAEIMPQGYFDIFDKSGIVFDGIGQANRLMRLVMDVHNNTRVWLNFGYTPDEMSKLRTYSQKTFPQNLLEPLENVGKNSPCPCGSGKRYKHCCGRSH